MQKFLIEWNKDGWIPLTTITFADQLTDKQVLDGLGKAIGVTAARMRAAGEDASQDDFRIKRV
jgi:hypothetical protein